MSISKPGDAMAFVARREAALLAFLCALAACNNPGGTPGQQEATGFAKPSSALPQSPGASAAAVALLGYDSFAPEGEATGSASGAGGSVGGSVPSAQQVSIICSDAIVGEDEECDDGDEGSDACTLDCQTRDQPIIPAASGELGQRDRRYLGLGRHPVSSAEEGFIVAFTDLTAEAPHVSASVYNRYGQRQDTGILSAGGNPLQDANPVTAALPGNAYAIAWTDFEGDGSDLGIALRRLNAQQQLAPLTFANVGREFSQRDPDLIWDGQQLVAAWVDFSDPFNGPDLRYRTFDADLNPTSGDLALADSELPEADVALAAVQGGWAAAYREGVEDGREYIVVKAQDRVTRVGPISGGPINDRPALVELDETHLLVVFSEAVVAPDGPANFSQLSYAVVDRSVSATLTSQTLIALDPLWSRSPPASLSSPSAERGADGVYVAWASEARPGDAAGDQLWLKYFGWGSPNPGVPPALEAGQTELLLPRTCEESVGDQRLPALARTGLPPYGGLAVAWEDYGQTQVTPQAAEQGQVVGEPDVVVHFAPTHPRDSTQSGADYFEEHWAGADGSTWNSHWTSVLTGTFTINTQRGAGQIVKTSSAAALALVHVNDRTALNVDLVTSLRLSAASRAGLIARRADQDSDSYLALEFGNLRHEPWRTYAMLDGVRTDIQVLPPPNNVPPRAAELAYRVRFRTETAEDGRLLVAARVWPDTSPEPAAWLFETRLAADSLIAQRLGTPGRFGVLVNPQVNRKATFDDFQAKFFDGSQLGELDAVTAAWPLPLKRSLAHYRRCQPEQPCEEAGGCCETSADCAEGVACGSKLGLNVPLGSHADACVVDHCANGKRDADEERPDCGGASCAPCACQVSATSGTSAYCPSTCPCGTGDASCTQDTHCVAGLSCSTLSGPKYGWPVGTGACTPFHCANVVLDIGETWPDCGGECGTCSLVEVTPSGGAISAAAGSLQKILAASPITLTSVTGLVEGQNLCLVTDSSEVTLDALAFNRVKNYTLTPSVPACFIVDANLLLQSTNLPAETLSNLGEVANLDWQLSNEPAQFQLSGTNITRWLASVGGSVHDAAQNTALLQPMYASGGALMGGTRYLVGGSTTSDWTFLHQPGTLFMVFRPDAAITGYLLGTVHDSSPSAGSGFGIYFDASVDPPRLRYRVGNGSSNYVFALHTTRSFPPGSKTVLASTMSDTQLESFREYDSIGSATSVGSLSTSAPFSVALVGAKASTNKTPFPGAIFEVVHYSGAMSQRARQAIVQFLRKKHGIEGQPAHCSNMMQDAALGESSVDCGGECGCSGACASACGLTLKNFDLSAAESYYHVNLLRRRPDYPAPDVSVSFSGGASQWGSYGPQYSVEGDDTPFRWQSPTELDSDATATLVYDLGQERPLGAVRQAYGAEWVLPSQYRIRVGGGTPLVWTEVVPTTAVGNEIVVLSTFSAVTARYVELTMIGTPAAFGGNTIGLVYLDELEVFPASSMNPPPNTSQGYDLTYLSSVSSSINSNMVGTANNLLDKSNGGVYGKTTATGDGLVTLDLGGVYEVSRIVLSFHVGQAWPNGGKLELGIDGAAPGTIVWNQVFDTGVGVQLGTYPDIYPVTKQSARYVRLTNYFVAGVGTSTGSLDEIQVF